MSEIPQDPSAQGDQPPQPNTSPPPPPPPMSAPGPAYGAQAQAPVSPSDARMWSLFAHIGGLVTTLLAQLVIYLIYKDRDPFIRRHAAQAPVSPSDARMWSLFAHIGGLVTTFLASLVIYLIYKDRDPFIRRHAAQALNFQIIIAIAYFVSSLLIFVVIGFITYPLAVI